MNYALIQPPFTLDFKHMEKKELKKYAAWFHDILPERIVELTKVVHNRRGFGEWAADMSVDSLDPLGRWFESHVEVRTQTRQEKKEIEARLVFPVDIPDSELTNRTLSLAMDIGMYFSQVVLKNLPGTEWDQPLRNARFADYGQPVLVGFGSVPMNPIRLAVTKAYAISHGKPAALRELYLTWANMRR